MVGKITWGGLAMSSDLDRRDFLKISTASVAGMAMSAYSFAEQASSSGKNFSFNSFCSYQPYYFQRPHRDS